MPLSNFYVFGEAVDAYMHLVYRLMYFFLILFMLSLTNIFTNLEGSDMREVRLRGGWLSAVWHLYGWLSAGWHL